MPTSRWVTAERPCSWTYSIGSSMVRMCSDRVLLMRSMMEASVVDFPEPVGPVRSTKPAGEPGQPFGDGGQAQLVEGRDVGGDHPEGQRRLALLGERAATEAGPVEPAQREVDVLLLVEGGLLFAGQSMPGTIASIWSPVRTGVFSIALSFPSTLIRG